MHMLHRRKDFALPSYSSGWWPSVTACPMEDIQVWSCCVLLFYLRINLAIRHARFRVYRTWALKSLRWRFADVHLLDFGGSNALATWFVSSAGEDVPLALVPLLSFAIDSYWPLHGSEDTKFRVKNTPRLASLHVQYLETWRRPAGRCPRLSDTPYRSVISRRVLVKKGLNMFDYFRMFAFLGKRNRHVQMFNPSAPAPRAMAFYRNSCSKVGSLVSTPLDMKVRHQIFLDPF